MHKFDVFSGSPENPVWLEVADGLNDAVARMEQKACAKPGRYFVYDTDHHAVVASIDSERSKVVRGKRNFNTAP